MSNHCPCDPRDAHVMDTYSGWSECIRKSDYQAFTELFQTIHPELLRFAWHYTRCEATAGDVVQDVFLRLWFTRDRLDPARSLKALLYTMVRNAALNVDRSVRLRKLDTIDETVEPAGKVNTEDEIEADDLSVILNRWIGQLPERRKEAFLLSRLHGLSHEEIGRIMGLSTRTVNAHVVLALKYLRTKLETLEAEKIPAFQPVL